MAIETLVGWAAWLQAGLSWYAPTIVGVFALWLAFVFAGGAGAIVRALGQARLASYFEFAVANFAVVGFFFLTAALEEALGRGAQVDRLLATLWLRAEAGDIGRIAALSALLFVLFTAIGGISGQISDWVGEEPTSTTIELRPRTVAERFAWISVMSPTAGFCEEVVFRGLLLAFALKLGADPVIAVAVTSLAFALGHAAYGLTWTVGSFVMGATAAVSVIATGTLWPAIVAHTLYDMTVYFIFEGGVPAEDEAAPAPAPAGFPRLTLPLR